MRFNSVLVILLFIAGIQQATAQFKSSVNSGNIGALYGYGWSEGPAVDQSSLYGEGTFKTRTSAYALAFNFAAISESKGFGGGGFLSGAFGGSPDKFMGENLGGGWSNSDGVWSEDFGLFFDGKFGPAFTYGLPDQHMRVGIRYFNWYQANTFGGVYNNSDDAAAIGVTADWSRLGFAYSFGSEMIPGLLVDSHAWDSHEVEAKYLLRDNKNLSVLVGVRGLTQILKETYRTTDEPGTKGYLLSFFIVVR